MIWYELMFECLNFHLRSINQRQWPPFVQLLSEMWEAGTVKGHYLYIRGLQRPIDNNNNKEGHMWQGTPLLCYMYIAET